MAKATKATSKTTASKAKQSKTPSVLTDAERGQIETQNKYELMFIVSAELPEATRQKAVDELNTVLKDNGAEVFHVDDWGKRDLAYKIKKQDSGYYLIYYFTLSNTANLKVIDQHLRLDLSFLRHLIIKRDEDYTIRDFVAEEEALEAEVKKQVEAQSSKKSTK